MTGIEFVVVGLSMWVSMFVWRVLSLERKVDRLTRCVFPVMKND